MIEFVYLISGIISLVVLICFFGMFSRLGDIRDRLDESLKFQDELLSQSRKAFYVAVEGADAYKAGERAKAEAAARAEAEKEAERVAAAAVPINKTPLIVTCVVLGVIIVLIVVFAIMSDHTSP